MTIWEEAGILNDDTETIITISGCEVPFKKVNGGMELYAEIWHIISSARRCSVELTLNFPQKEQESFTLLCSVTAKGILVNLRNFAGSMVCIPKYNFKVVKLERL